MFSDHSIVQFDKALRTVFASTFVVREPPGMGGAEACLSVDERAHAGALMRVNHVGEVCAQALYQGQILSCRDSAIREALGKAANEEVEHLAWTERRISELGARKSLLNPLWYIGALSMGVLAARLGGAWNLGFLAETERQVESHLSDHLSRLPVRDARSRAIVQQMKLDEAEHARMAVALGARELPQPVKVVMRAVSGAMTHTAYYF